MSDDKDRNTLSHEPPYASRSLQDALSAEKDRITVVQVNDPSVTGTTLFVEDPKGKPAKAAHRMDTGGLITPTAVYIPAGHKKAAKELNVILWFHGHWVKDYQAHIFGPDTIPDETKLRESVDAAVKVDAAARDVVLIVPFLGYRSLGDGKDYVMPNFNGGNAEEYLVNLLDVLVRKGRLGTKTVNRLVIACHSGSGHIMRQATRDLNTLKGNLKECWGYDCMYTYFTSWMDEFRQQALYFYQGTGSYPWVFRDHWMHAYGTPMAPKTPRLDHVFLAPGTKNPPADMKALTDQEVFQSFCAIQGKKDSGQKLSAYESFRLNELDPLLNKTKEHGKWDQKVKDSVKGHYEVVRDLVAPRIVGLFQPRLSGAHLIATCKAATAPPPKPKPAAAGQRR